MRLLAATAVVCGLANQAWAQAATVALPGALPSVSPVPIDSVTGHPSWLGRGIYAFFVTNAAPLRRAGLSVGDDGLVYIGKTNSSFRERLSHHRAGTTNLGTSVRSVLSHCAIRWPCPAATPDEVSRFIRANFRVAMVPLDDARVIDSLEARLIESKRPPLNMAGVSNANSRRLKHLRQIFATTSIMSPRAVISTLAKGAWIGGLVQLPVTGIVGYLDVRNGRKTLEEAALDGARTVGTAAAVGALAAGALSAAASAGVPIWAPVLMPLAVVGGGLYVWVSADRIWDAMDERTRTEVEARFAAAAGELGRRLDAQGRELDLQIGHLREQIGRLREGVKVFASTSIRFGGVTNLSAAQLEAACGEAHAQGLKAVVHLHRSDALRLAADAGCDQVEHGWLLEPADVAVFAESGMYLGNQIDLLFRNYEDNGDRFAGVGGYTMEGFANLQAARPGALEVFRRAAATAGVRIVYSTDANAGSHGANTDELVAYVEQGGQDPMDAVVSATSLAAESGGPRRPHRRRRGRLPS